MTSDELSAFMKSAELQFRTLEQAFLRLRIEFGSERLHTSNLEHDLAQIQKLLKMDAPTDEVVRLTAAYVRLRLGKTMEEKSGEWGKEDLDKAYAYLDSLKANNESN